MSSTLSKCPRCGQEIIRRPREKSFNFWRRRTCGYTCKTPHGQSVRCAKLTEKDVLAIRDSAERTGALAVHYGVSAGTISNIRAGRAWAWLLPEAK